MLRQQPLPGSRCEDHTRNLSLRRRLHVECHASGRRGPGEKLSGEARVLPSAHIFVAGRRILPQTDSPRSPVLFRTPNKRPRRYPGPPADPGTRLLPVLLQRCLAFCLERDHVDVALAPSLLQRKSGLCSTSRLLFVDLLCPLNRVRLFRELVRPQVSRSWGTGAHSRSRDGQSASCC